MKRLFLLSLAALPFINIAAQDDDLYFTPDMTGVVEDVQVNKPSNARVDNSVYENSKYSVYNTNARDEDEYNRRYSFSGGYQTEGGADYSLDYESNDTVFNTDTIFDDTDDYAYSRRILRFHSPRVAVALSSPYYWDLVYGYGVYDYLYDAYYDPFFYSWGWGYGWSWGPWSCWYGGLWGWHHPYHWSYWGWGPGWHYGYRGGYHWNHGRYSDRGGRGGFRNRFDHGKSIRTSHLANGGNSSMSRGTFGGRTNGIASRTSAARSLRGGNNVGLRASNNNARTTMGRGAASRSSYADYARSRSVNTPDSRVTNRTVGRTTTQNRTSYSRPSSSRSTYSPSRSSYEGGRSVYTPSRSSSSSSSSRSSRSYSAPSRSSSSGSFGGGRSSFGGGRSGGFGGGGGSRGGGFGGGGGRGGGGRR